MPNPKPRYTCDECKYEGGQHTIPSPDPDVPDRIVRCPQYLATVQQKQAQQFTADAHTEAFKAAKRIIRDAAERIEELDGNQLREMFEHARVDSPVIGAAFSACAREGVIEPTGRYVQSTEATTRHRIAVWRSLCYRGSAA